jgi:hypothetical protein
MTLPPNIRVNIGAPFPAVVRGSGPISISRANGIWTIGMALPTTFTTQVPAASALPTDYVMVYDSVAGIWVAVTLGTIMAGTQRAVAATPVSILPTDYVLHLNLTISSNIVLPPYLSRAGMPLMFKDVGMQATAFPQTLSAATGETIDGLASIPLAVNGQSIRVVPANDGVNTGWFTE